MALFQKHFGLSDGIPRRKLREYDWGGCPVCQEKLSHSPICRHHLAFPVMPLINVKLIEGVFTPKQKQEMIRKLTDTMVEIEGENMRSVTSVVVEEVKSGDWGIGGNCLTTADVKQLAAGERLAKAA